MRKRRFKRLVTLSVVGIVAGYPLSYWALKQDGVRGKLPAAVRDALYRSWGSGGGSSSRSLYSTLYQPLKHVDYQWQRRTMQRRLEGDWTGEDESGHDVFVRVKEIEFDRCEVTVEVEGKELWSGELTPKLQRWSLGTVDRSPSREEVYETAERHLLAVDWSGEGTVRLTWKPKLRPQASMEGWTAGWNPFYVFDLELTRAN